MKVFIYTRSWTALTLITLCLTQIRFTSTCMKPYVLKPFCSGITGGPSEGYHLQQIADRFETLNEVTSALKKLGMDDCGLIFGTQRFLL